MEARREAYTAATAATSEASSSARGVSEEGAFSGSGAFSLGASFPSGFWGGSFLSGKRRPSANMASIRKKRMVKTTTIPVRAMRAPSSNFTSSKAHPFCPGTFYSGPTGSASRSQTATAHEPGQTLMHYITKNPVKKLPAPACEHSRGPISDWLDAGQKCGKINL